SRSTAARRTSSVPERPTRWPQSAARRSCSTSSARPTLQHESPRRLKIPVSTPAPPPKSAKPSQKGCSAMPLTKSEKIWMDGELVPWDDAKIHILTHTLHYGCGVFEGIRAYATSQGPAVFRLTDHINRLMNSAKIFMIEMPYSPQQIIDATKLTVRENKLDACYVRPLVYLGYGEMGLNPLPAPVNVAIAVRP